MSTPGMWEIIFLAVIAMLIFGPDKLPGMARSAGKTIAKLKHEAASTMDELKRTADLQEIREVAGELKSTTADLKRASALTGPLASPAGATKAVGAAGALALSSDEDTVGTARAEMPAPFDPDAT